MYQIIPDRGESRLDRAKSEKSKKTGMGLMGQNRAVAEPWAPVTWALWRLWRALVTWALVRVLSAGFSEQSRDLGASGPSQFWPIAVTFPRQTP